MRIKITTDSTCDLPKELLQEFDIFVFPLSVVRAGISLQDGVEICPQDVFDHVADGGEICTTSAVNIAEFLLQFGTFSRRYDAVIHISISSEFSCCHQNATLAAAEFSNVYTVDSRQLTAGVGELAIFAREMADQGKAPQEIVDALEKLADKVDTSFMIDRLDYLRKGGRCSTVAALGANLLRLKPTIEVVNGKMQVAKKYRGDFEKNIPNFIRERMAAAGDLELRRVYLGAVCLSPQGIQAAKEAVLAVAPFTRVIVYTPGCTVSCHCGPGTLGLVFVRK